MSFEISGKTYETDEEGYLLNLADWTKEAAEHLGRRGKGAAYRQPLGSHQLPA
jgi:sulfur relay (sulfurtransferase) DsrC/TusE family protein